MPRLASARLVAELQRRTENHFYGDTAAWLSDVVNTLGAYGQPDSVTTTPTEIACSFTDLSGLQRQAIERWKSYADIEEIVAEIRFTSPAPAKGNRVTLKGRFDGTSYVDKTFEIVGIMDRDAMGYVCALKAVQI